jgi:YspA, cpYpsA-related SLOG family
MKTIIAGSRSITSYETLCAVMETCGVVVTEVVSGTARGVDTLGERWAEERGIPVVRFPADWSQGRGAGFTRNERMAEYADACVVLWDGSSRGSVHMAKTAKRLGLVTVMRRFSMV